jgi:hypothetical protein
MRTLIPLFVIALLSFAITQCSMETSYQSWAERELRSGVQNDSLFLGYYFGMPRQEFRDHSFEMNRQGIMTGLVKIEYQFEDLGNRATKIFYPDFNDDVITRIPVEISYNAWAPWNEDTWPENLIIDLKDHFEEIYGGRFRQVYVPDIERRALVMIQGNREIRLYRHSETTVMADFRDLNVYRPVKED